MKKVIIMLSVLAAVAGCTKWIKPDSEEDTLSKHFKHTGCSHDTRGIYTDDPSLLSLKYENGDLRVTRTNAELRATSSTMTWSMSKKESELPTASAWSKR